MSALEQAWRQGSITRAILLGVLLGMLIGESLVLGMLEVRGFVCKVRIVRGSISSDHWDALVGAAARRGWSDVTYETLTKAHAKDSEPAA